MIVDLEDAVAPGEKDSARLQVVEALSGLGFPAKQAEQAVDSVMAQQPDGDTATALRAALALLGKNR